MASTSLSVRVILCAYFVVSLCIFFPSFTTALHGGEEGEESGSFPAPVPVPAKHGAVVKRDQRWSMIKTDSGEISAVKVSDGKDGFYHLQFITMEPNSLFLPVHLHSDMVFYVDSGSGTLSWVDLEKDTDELRQVELQTGDIYRLRTGSFFYLQSNLASDRRKLRISAIFSDSKEEIREGSSFGAYSSVRDLILGFDNKVLQAALNVDEQVVQELRSGQNQPMIVHGVTKGEELLGIHYQFMRAFLGRMNNGINIIDVNKKDKKNKAYNILEAKHDIENCNGWSLVVTNKQLDALKGSDFGIFLVNLTKGAMMGPHWNPLTAEIAVVLSGRGMVHVVCPSISSETECKNTRFRVEEGDVFVVPRYHPMAQISFNNGSFVFVGFTTTQKDNHPQYVFGAASVFQTLDKRVLAASLGVSNTTMDEILSAQREAIILECTSCAEEEEKLMEEEIQREKEEEAKRREEEEARQEKEAAIREQEQAKKREEEEAKKREEHKKKQEEEEARKQKEEEVKKREEQKRKQEEEAARKQKEEEAARQAEEEAHWQQQQEEEAARRQQQEEEAARRQQQEEEAARRQQQEEEAARQAEEEAHWQQQQEEEAARRQQQEEEAARRQQQEEEAARRQQQEEEAAREQEETDASQHEHQTKRRQEEAARRQQQEAEGASEPAKQQQEVEAAREREEAKKRHQEEAVARGRKGGRGGGGGHQGQGEGEAASSAEEEMALRERDAEAAARAKQVGG